jgi:hypothetical protein
MGMHRPRLTEFLRNNVIGLVALFVALGGTAIATQVNRTTKVVHVQAEASKKAKSKPGPRGPQGPAGPQGATGAQGASGLAGVGGRMSGAPPTCGDDDQNGDDCATVTLNLQQAGRVLLVANANWRTTAFDDPVGPGSTTDDANAIQGSCQLTADGAAIAHSYQNVVEAAGGADEPWSFALGLAGAQVATSGVTGALPAGSHTFAFACTEIDGDVDWSQGRISAVSLGAG